MQPNDLQKKKNQLKISICNNLYFELEHIIDLWAYIL